MRNLQLHDCRHGTSREVGGFFVEEVEGCLDRTNHDHLLAEEVEIYDVACGNHFQKMVP